MGIARVKLETHPPETLRRSFSQEIGLKLILKKLFDKTTGRA